MARPVPSPLGNLITVTQLTDHEVRKVMRDATAEAGKIMRTLDGDIRPGAQIRSAQIALANMQVQAWAGVGDATRVGIGDAIDSSTMFQALFDERLLEGSKLSSSYWRQSMLAQARSGIDAYIGRRQNGFNLSERVYRNTALAKGYVDRAINNALLLGKSARELANDVIGYMNPNVAGGASYAAMRLARTEVNNAFHSNSVGLYQKTPWVTRVKWNLSGSHPRPDVCNEYAEDSHIPGGGAGIFLPLDVPAKPHPNCFCYTTPVPMPLDEYAKRFQDGEFDDYIDKQMGCSRVA